MILRYASYAEHLTCREHFSFSVLTKREQKNATIASMTARSMIFTPPTLLARILGDGDIFVRLPTG